MEPVDQVHVPTVRDLRNHERDRVLYQHPLGPSPLWDDHGVVSPEALRKYADTLTDFRAPTSSVSLFIDFTIRQTCLPGIFQELFYTGYKKYHGMKFQGLIGLNSLLVHLDEPYHMPQNHVGILAESKLLITLEQHMIQPESDEGDLPEHHFFQIYGNSAYGVSPMMVSPFSGVGELTAAVECHHGTGSDFG